mgnify:CR=1 FL=1
MLTIKINNIKDLFAFVRICNGFSSDIDLISAGFVLDAKSITVF